MGLWVGSCITPIYECSLFGFYQLLGQNLFDPKLKLQAVRFSFGWQLKKSDSILCSLI
jgi:hypothetical protein